MSKFFNDDLLLYSKEAIEIYKEIKDLPIIDYHCHLNQYKIENDEKFNDIGELWLKEDHYKWRAMRLADVDEFYITGKASFEEKFMKYAEIFPLLVGNPLYYWTQMELKIIFDINEPLNKESAKRIYDNANKKLKELSVRKLLKKFKVEYIATTDSPIDDLNSHGIYDGIKVVPTFRPDKLLNLDEEEIAKLSSLINYELNDLDAFLNAIEERLNYFTMRSSKIADHGFLTFPSVYISKIEANELYLKRANLTNDEKEKLFGFLLVSLAKLYKKYNILMQLHFGVRRNVNKEKFKVCGVDSGFDVIANSVSIDSLISFLNELDDENRPCIALYTLNDSNLKALACVTGAFKNVKIGPAWWFNDTVLGIRNNLNIIAEYSVLGTNYGMLTDSRSFSSYVRFDFFRRLLADYLGNLVSKGEYSLELAKENAKNICYYNIKNVLGE